MPEPMAGAEDSAAGDLAEMVAIQRRTVEQLRPCSGPGCVELAAHERTLALLEAQLRRRMGGGDARAHTPLQAAHRVADVFQFSVPPSHRKQLGQAVTAAKSAFVQGLKPFHVEVLRPQHAFNQEMLAVLEHVHGMRSTSTGMDMSGWVARRLMPLARPTDWSVPSHRGTALAGAVKLVKHSYLKALGPVLRELLEGQRQWNEAAVQLLADAVRPQQPSLEDSSRRVGELQALANPLAHARSLQLRVSSALWGEVLRRQIAFNQEITLSLADLLGARPPVTAPGPEDYASWYAGARAAALRSRRRGGEAAAGPPVHQHRHARLRDAGAHPPGLPRVRACPVL